MAHSSIVFEKYEMTPLGPLLNQDSIEKYNKMETGNHLKNGGDSENPYE